MTIDVTVITASTPRAELEEALAVTNREAKDTHASPRYDQLHQMLNLLLTYWQTADA